MAPAPPSSCQPPSTGILLGSSAYQDRQLSLRGHGRVLPGPGEGGRKLTDPPSPGDARDASTGAAPVRPQGSPARAGSTVQGRPARGHPTIRSQEQASCESNSKTSMSFS